MSEEEEEEGTTARATNGVGVTIGGTNGERAVGTIVATTEAAVEAGTIEGTTEEHATTEDATTEEGTVVTPADSSNTWSCQRSRAW